MSIQYSINGDDGNCFNKNIIPFFDYQKDISNVPDSIAIIPFIALFLPIVFICDGTLNVNEVDETFLDSIKNYRKTYQKMIPEIRLKGRVVYKKSIKNQYITNGDCSLYSGGLDALNTLCMEEEKIKSCIAILIWNPTWQKNLEPLIVDVMSKFNKNYYPIRTNALVFCNQNQMDAIIKKIHYVGNFWETIHHGIFLIGAASPIAYLNGYKKIYIASSHTKRYTPAIWGSTPELDNCFKFGSTIAEHNGYQYDRCEKVKNVYTCLLQKNISVNISVCWRSGTGINCGKCEKCIRTYLNCLVMNVDYNRLGIVPPPNMLYAQNVISKLDLNNANLGHHRHHYKAMVKHLRKTFGKHKPTNLLWLDSLKMPSNSYTRLKSCWRRYAPYWLKRLLYIILRQKKH